MSNDGSSEQPDTPRTRKGAASSPLPRVYQGPSVPDERDPDTDPAFDELTEIIGQLFERNILPELISVRREIAEYHSGPLPHQSTLKGYEDVVPGSAQMIFANFEEQGRHRRKMEQFNLKWGTVRSFAGLACGFIVCIAFLLASYTLIQDGHGLAGTVLGTVDLVALVGVFVYGSHVVRDERVQKAKILAGRDGEQRPPADES